MRCEHNRDDYRTCPHCLGIGAASVKPPALASADEIVGGKDE